MEVSAVTVVEETLVGRQAELATVEEILARAEARPQGIVLEGECGDRQDAPLESRARM